MYDVIITAQFPNPSDNFVEEATAEHNKNKEFIISWLKTLPGYIESGGTEIGKGIVIRKARFDSYQNALKFAKLSQTAPQTNHSVLDKTYSDIIINTTGTRTIKIVPVE
jgi:hypothetical protein